VNCWFTKPRGQRAPSDELGIRVQIPRSCNSPSSRNAARRRRWRTEWPPSGLWQTQRRGTLSLRTQLPRNPAMRWSTRCSRYTPWRPAEEGRPACVPRRERHHRRDLRHGASRPRAGRRDRRRPRQPPRASARRPLSGRGRSPCRQLRPGLPVVWIRVGNTRNADLLRRAAAMWARVIEALARGETLIELS
jgi:hypothetical protein